MTTNGTANPKRTMMPEVTTLDEIQNRLRSIRLHLHDEFGVSELKVFGSYACDD